MPIINTPTAKVLLAECDLQTVAEVKNFLAEEGFSVTAVTSQLSALELLARENFDLALMDISLSDGNGYSLCMAVKQKYDIPVIFLSHCCDENSVVTGLDMGGDDFITIPFRTRELLSRIRSVLRRSGKMLSVLEHKDIRVDTVKGMVTKNGRELYLSALEYRILLVFLSNKGRILSRERLLEEVWDIGGNFVSDNTLTVYIKRIREKIEDNPTAPQIIRTVRGKGYKTGE